MDIGGLLTTAASLMVTGMVGVFVFLTILISAVTLMILQLQNLRVQQKFNLNRVCHRHILQQSALQLLNFEINKNNGAA